MKSSRKRASAPTRQSAKDAEAAKVKADATADSFKAQAESAAKAKADAEAAVAKAKTDAADAGKSVNKALVQLTTTALKHKVEIKRDGKAVDVFDATDAELRLAVIAKLDGAEVPAEKRDNAAYVEARYDLAMTRDTVSAGAFAALAPVINAPARTDAAPGTAKTPSSSRARRCTKTAATRTRPRRTSNHADAN
jgi:hypothetical protein